MYFVLSKTLGFFAQPSNVLILLALAGTALLFSRFARTARGLLIASMVGIVVLGISPVGKVLLYILETRFPAWTPSADAPTGFIVLGGSVDPDVSAGHSQIALTDAAERLTIVPELARRYPTARIIFTGGNGSLFGGSAEADYVRQLFASFGIPQERIEVEGRSRNTLENAQFTKPLAAPKPGDRWVMISSAYHMPRAMAAFRNVDFDVEAFPVDWQFAGRSDLYWPFRSFIAGLGLTDGAVREFIGLLVYRLTGHSRELFPAPRSHTAASPVVSWVTLASHPG
jgi:uncharacterized SAM-binding protein YcdF (DUF218 family)